MDMLFSDRELAIYVDYSAFVIKNYLESEKGSKRMPGLSHLAHVEEAVM